MAAVGSSVTKNPGPGLKTCKSSLPLPHLPGDTCEVPSCLSLTCPICATRARPVGRFLWLLPANTVSPPSTSLSHLCHLCHLCHQKSGSLRRGIGQERVCRVSREARLSLHSCPGFCSWGVLGSQHAAQRGELQPQQSPWALDSGCVSWVKLENLSGTQFSPL